MLNMALEKDSQNRAQIFAYPTQLSEGHCLKYLNKILVLCHQYGGLTYWQIFRKIWS